MLADLNLLQVKKLQKVLQEETALHSILENALDHAAVTLADMSYIPTNVRTAIHRCPRNVPSICKGIHGEWMLLCCN